MSNFTKTVKDPRTGKYERAQWLDQGKEVFKVRFPDGKEYMEADHKWQTPPQGVVLKTIGEWERVLKIKIVDPDGFDRADRYLDQRVWTQKGFTARMIKCTIAKDKAEPHKPQETIVRNDGGYGKEIKQNTGGQTQHPPSVSTISAKTTPEPISSSDQNGQNLSEDSEKIAPKVERDPVTGQLKPGSVLNPKGTKKGAKHMKTLLLEHMRATIGTTRGGDKVTLDKALMLVLLDAALRGNMKAATFLWEAIDGKAKESLDLTTFDDWSATPERRAEVLKLLGVNKL